MEHPTSSTDAVLLKSVDVARRLSVSRSTVDRLIAAGELPTVRFGAQIVRVPSDMLDRWIRDRVRGQGGAGWSSSPVLPATSASAGRKA